MVSPAPDGGSATARQYTDRIVTMTVPVGLIDKHTSNYNQHPPEQVEGLGASYTHLGQYRSVVLWQRPGGRFTLVAGEGFTTGASGKGATEIRAEVLPENTPPDVIEEILLADNLHARHSVPDEGILARLLKEAQERGTPLPALGSDEEELRQMLAGLASENEGEFEGDGADGEDDVGEPQTRVMPGDLWALGRHRVLCGDSLDEATVARLLAGVSPQAVIADPPYGISIVNKEGHVGGGKQRATFHEDDGSVKRVKMPVNTYAFVIGDETTDTAIAAFSFYYGRFPKALHLWWGANHYCHGLPGSSCWIVWDKENGDTSFADCELAWCSDKGAVRIFRHLWNGMMRASEKGRRIHPNQKPAQMFSWFYERWGAPGDVILDPFLGSGPTLIAAERLGDRTVYGLEMSADYVNTVLTRWEKETGQTAVLLSRETHASAEREEAQV